MAIANSYAPVHPGPVIAFTVPKPLSFGPNAPGPAITFMPPIPTSIQRPAPAMLLLNSSSTTQPRITSAVQRGPTSDICDIQGFMFDTNGEFISVDSIEYSTAGPFGPWTAGTILTGDVNYVWTFSGSSIGQPFWLPTSLFPGPIAGTIYVRMNVSWP